MNRDRLVPDLVKISQESIDGNHFHVSKTGFYLPSRINLNPCFCRLFGADLAMSE